MSHAYVDSSKASADYGIMPASICYYVLAMGTIMCINREERDVVNEKEFFSHATYIVSCDKGVETDVAQLLQFIAAGLVPSIDKTKGSSHMYPGFVYLLMGWPI